MPTVVEPGDAEEPQGRAVVVVPVRDEAEGLPEQLAALRRCVDEESGPWQVEVVVADNGSTDGTLDLTRRAAQAGAVDAVLDASQRPGTAAACNVAIRAMPGEVYLFAHGDDVVQPGWLLHHLRAFDAGADITVGAWFTPAHGEGRHQARTELALWGRPYALGANHGVHRRVLARIGGYDETVFAEDAEFCWRALDAGFSMVPVPGAVTRRGAPRSAVGRFGKSLGYGRGQRRLLRRGLGPVRRARRDARRRLVRLLARPDALLDRRRRATWCDGLGAALGLLLPVRDVPLLPPSSGHADRSG